MSMFDDIDFGMLQQVIFPLVKSLGGPDLEDMVSDGEAPVRAAAELLSECAGLLDMCAEALADGILTNDEINALILDAGDIGEAYDALRNIIFNFAGPEE